MIVTNDSKSDGKGTCSFEQLVTETPPIIPSSRSSQFASSAQPGTPSHEDAGPFAPRGIDAPPEFSTWDARYYLTSRGDIVSAQRIRTRFVWLTWRFQYSHDSHLNEDGEALYRFLLDHLQPPKFQLHCRGTHKEQRMRVGNTPHHDSQRCHHHRVHGGNTGKSCSGYLY